MHESMMDFWFSEEVEKCWTDGRFDPLAVLAIVRLMTQTMLMAEWTLGRLHKEGPPVRKTYISTEVKAPELEDPERREKWIFLLTELLDRSINRLENTQKR
ncbi:unnamed protein product [Caenorhabditis sp. 36 PRJEB53466]|nr:unnamed protein product [Caenorhabditis sp. 36 PRJEB53466]